MSEIPQSRPSGVDLDLVEYLIVAVPESSQLESVATALAQLVESAAIRVLDLVVIMRHHGDTSVRKLEIEDVAGFKSLRVVDAEVGGFLSDHDIEMAALTLGRDMAAVVIVAEDSWAQPLARAAREAGGRILAGERIPRTRLSTSAAAHSDFDAARPSTEDARRAR